MTPASRPARRLALAAGLLTAVLISCGREVTGPVSAPVNAFKRFASLAFSPQYTTALSSSALRAALTQVAFERVRITLRREDGSIALDTVVDFPAGADSLTLALIVPLPASASSTGVPFSLNLNYVNAAGDTVFRGGPSAVTVFPSAAGSTPPPPVQIPVHYTGTGASATSVTISPRLVNGIAGQSTSFSAVARAADGSAIAGTPVVFTSADAGVITVNSSSGAATLIGRGTAKVYAQLLTGPSDSATVTVLLPASRIELGSGTAQTAPAGTTLPQPIVARVLASDGIGVGGVTVNFAVSSGGGSVTPATAVSAADGSVNTSWKLGGTAGAQTMTVTSVGLSGSPITVSATALPVVASRLSITTGPVGGKAGAPMGAVIAAQDALGNTVTTFTGDVTVAIGTNPGASTLGGTATVKAVNGVATFSGLTLNKPGTGYTLTFSSASLASATTAAFNIVAGDAAKLVFGPMPAAADVGIAIAPPIQVSAQDSSGNTVTSFTGAVTVAIGANTGGGTLSGTLTRNAVAGIATFNDLSINKKGSSYTLVASATGLIGGTSAAFNMAPGVATGISVVSGGGQTALAGAALGPIVLQLRDALGNGIAGGTITLAVATGGGTLGAASFVTDADGKGTVAWTLGNTGGVQTITASSTGVPAATVAATATVPPTSAKTLLISTQPQASQVAGTSGTNIVVQAKDSLGAVVPLFIGNVTMTIASGPVGATIIGTATRAAVAGVATFSGVSFDKAGAYTLTLASAGLTSATSTSFTVIAGAAKNIAADSGQAQTGNAGQALGASPVVKVTDQYGNAVGAGTSLTWTVATGGGSVDSTTTLTNSSGRTRVKWTLGATVGAQTLNVTGSGLLPNPLTFNATANGVAYSKLWTGAIDTLWSTAGNWSPAGAPSATDSVRVDSVANMLTVTSGQTIAKLVVAPGAKVNLNGKYLTVNGSVSALAGASFANSGVLVLNGTGTVVGPALPYTNVQGNYSLSGATNFLSDIEVKTGGTLNTNSFNVNIAGAFSTSTSGVLVMSSGTVTVGGNAFFAGGSENGLLTGGTLRIRGNFTQSNSGTGVGEAFRASGTHQVVFDSVSAAGLVHTISIAAPDTVLSATCTAGRSCFNSVNFTHIAGASAGIKFNSSAKALGAVDLSGGGLDSLVMPTTSLLTIAGNFSTGCCTPRRFNRVALGGTTNNGGVSGVAVDTMIFFGTGQSAPPNGILIGTNSVRISGTVSMSQGNIPGDLTVDGATAVLDIATTAGYLQATGNFTTKNGGKLKMTDAADSLNIGGTASFTGGATTGLLTAGTITTMGDVTTVGTAFDASGTHTLLMANTAAKTLTSDPGSTTVGFQNLHFANGGDKNVLMGAGWAVNVKGKLLARSTSGIIGSSNTNSQLWMKAGGAVIDSTPADTSFKFARLMVDSVTALPRDLRVGDFMISGTQPLFDSLQTTASVTVNGGLLDLNGHKLRMLGTGKPFLTSSGGRLKMMNPLDSLSVYNGNGIYFVGGSTAGLLTEGSIMASGDFVTGGAGASPQSFSATSHHAVSFTGTGMRRLRMLNGGFSASHFAELYHGFTDTLYLKTDVYAESFETGIVAIHPLRADTSFSPLLVAQGADIRNVVFDGVRLELDNGQPVTDLNNVAFINQDPAATQFAIKRSGTGTTAGSAGAIVPLSGSWVFATTPTTGRYLDAQDTDGAIPDALMVDFNGSVSPVTHGGKAVFSNGATSNWLAGMAYSLAFSGRLWSDSTAWSPVGIPGSNDDVTIGGENTVFLSGNTAVHSVAFSLGALNLGSYNLTVGGDVTGGSGSVTGTGALQIAGAGSHALTLWHASNIAVGAGAIVTQGDSTYATGDVNISGMWVPNGHRLRVDGTLSILAGGGLKMTQATDNVYAWNAVFGGVASDTLLTNGYLVIRDNFQQVGGTKSFAPTGAHVTSLWAQANTSSLRAALKNSKGALPAESAATSRLSAAGSRRRAFTETAVPTGGRRRFITDNNVSFANPGYSASHFNILEIDPSWDITLGSDVFATRTQVVAEPFAYINSAASTQYRLVQQGASLNHLTFNHVAVQVDAGGTLDEFRAITFMGQDTTADQLTLSRNGGAVTLDTLYFNERLGATGHFVKLVDGPSPFTVTVNSVYPGSHGGHVSTPGGSTFTNWIASRKMTVAASGNWSAPATFSPAGLPSYYDSVAVLTGATLNVDTYGQVRDVVIAAGAGFNVGAYTTLDVYGNWTADTTSAVTSGGGAQYTNFYGDAQVRGRLYNASVYKSMTLIGRTIFDGSVSVGDYYYNPITFDVNGQVATINGGFSTWYGGRFKMTNAAGILNLQSGASLTGGSTNGLLTDGTLNLRGTFTAAGQSFSATGSHVTNFTGPTTIDFQGLGGFGTTAGHFATATNTMPSSTGAVALMSDAYAEGNLNSAPATSDSVRFFSASPRSFHALGFSTTSTSAATRTVFDGVALDVGDGGSMAGTVYGLSFRNITGMTAFKLSRSLTSSVTLNGWAFQYLGAGTPTKFIDATSTGSPMTITMTGHTPSLAQLTANSLVLGNFLVTSNASVTWP